MVGWIECTLVGGGIARSVGGGINNSALKAKACFLLTRLPLQNNIWRESNLGFDGQTHGGIVSEWSTDRHMVESLAYVRLTDTLRNPLVRRTDTRDGIVSECSTDRHAAKSANVLWTDRQRFGGRIMAGTQFPNLLLVHCTTSFFPPLKSVMKARLISLL